MTTISDAADSATEHVREAASHGRTTLLDLTTQFMRLINGAREAEGRGVDSLLDRLGLQRRQSAMAPILWFAAGAAFAGAAVLLTSTAPGERLRRRISNLLAPDDRERNASKATTTEPRARESERQAPPSGGNGIHETG